MLDVLEEGGAHGRSLILRSMVKSGKKVGENMRYGIMKKPCIATTAAVHIGARVTHHIATRHTCHLPVASL